MANTNFPTWADCLNEFAAGMREHKAKKQVTGSQHPYETPFDATKRMERQREFHATLEAMARINARYGELA